MNFFDDQSWRGEEHGFSDDASWRGNEPESFSTAFSATGDQRFSWELLGEVPAAEGYVSERGDVVSLCRDIREQVVTVEEGVAQLQEIVFTNPVQSMNVAESETRLLHSLLEETQTLVRTAAGEFLQAFDPTAYKRLQNIHTVASGLEVISRKTTWQLVQSLVHMKGDDSEKAQAERARIMDLMVIHQQIRPRTMYDLVYYCFQYEMYAELFLILERSDDVGVMYDVVWRFTQRIFEQSLSKPLYRFLFSRRYVQASMEPFMEQLVRLLNERIADLPLEEDYRLTHDGWLYFQMVKMLLDVYRQEQGSGYSSEDIPLLGHLDALATRCAEADDEGFQKLAAKRLAA